MQLRILHANCRNQPTTAPAPCKPWPPAPKPTNWPMASAKWPTPLKTKPDSRVPSSYPLKPASALNPPAKNKTKTTAKANKAA